VSGVTCCSCREMLDRRRVREEGKTRRETQIRGMALQEGSISGYGTLPTQGERLLSGSATPDEWIVRGGRAENRVAPEGALTLAQLQRVAELATRVEAVCGGPQDVEWAIADDELFLLQARPTTALPVPPHVEIPTKGFWFKDETHYHAPITPFGASVLPGGGGGCCRPRDATVRRSPAGGPATRDRRRGLVPVRVERRSSRALERRHSSGATGRTRPILGGGAHHPLRSGLRKTATG
jgi:hypothetical protein